jgi:Arc/MetJ-type ribon-helix-helix transcriptional regulator
MKLTPNGMWLYRTYMTIQLKPELERLIRKDIERGGYQSVEQFVERAIQLLHEEEHLLQADKDVIHEAIGEGLAQLDRGEGSSGRASRARLQEKKAAWVDSRKPSS